MAAGGQEYRNPVPDLSEESESHHTDKQSFDDDEEAAEGKTTYVFPLVEGWSSWDPEIWSWVMTLGPGPKAAVPSKVEVYQKDQPPLQVDYQKKGGEEGKLLVYPSPLTYFGRHAMKEWLEWWVDVLNRYGDEIDYRLACLASPQVKWDPMIKMVGNCSSVDMLLRSRSTRVARRYAEFEQLKKDIEELEQGLKGPGKALKR